MAAQSKPNGHKLSIATLNVPGINSLKKRRKVFSWMQNQNIDISFIQESMCTEKRVSVMQSTWPGISIHAPTDSPHSRGVAMLFKRGLDFKILNKHNTDDGRKSLVNFEYESSTFSLINIYAPNNSELRRSFFAKLETWISQNAQPDSTIILGGDFNCSLDDTKKCDPSRKNLKRLLKRFSLIDMWSKMNPGKNGYTWSNGKEQNSRIDYMFV